jgi:hypothetical protein
MLGSKRFYNIAATVKVKTTSSSCYLYTSTNARALRIQPYVQVYRARTRSADSTVPTVSCFDSVVLRIRAARAPPLGLANTGGAGGAVRRRRLHLLLPYYLVTERPPRPRRHGRAVVPPPPRPQMPAGLGRRHGGRQEEEEDDAQERDDHAGRGASLRHAHVVCYSIDPGPATRTALRRP